MTPSRPLPHLIAPLLLALAGCASAPVIDATYVLKPQQSVDVARGLRITYDSFSDSRCPPNTHCIWAGRLAFRFIVAGPGGQEEFTLGPDQPVAVPAALHGARVALDLGALPPARVPSTRPAELIAVTLKVSAP